MANRVAIVGAGAVTAAGPGQAALEGVLRAGRRCFGPVRGFATTGHAVDLAAEVPLDSAALRELVRGRRRPGTRRVAPAVERGWSRSDLLALLAAGEALDEALGTTPPDDGWAQTSVLVGGSTGGMLEAETWLAEVVCTPGARLDEAQVPAALLSSQPISATADALAEEQVPAALLSSQPISATADALAEEHGLLGARCTLNTACSSSANALLLGAWMVRAGRARRVLAGGTDALSRITYTGFGSLGLLDPQGCRPFDADRRGLTLGEGAAFFVLEDLASARARGARVRGLLLGGALGGEAHHPTSPEPGGHTAARVMRDALADAGVDPTAIAYVNAHGTGTPHNDVAETQAIHAALGEAARRVAVSSTKSMVGHCLGAAGAVEAVATLLGMEKGFLPPTAGLTRPDPACDLDYVPGVARPADLTVALSNSFGFGGNLTTLVLGRAPVAGRAPAGGTR